MTSTLSARGSTRSWRRLRRLVLERDGYRCQLPLPDGRRCGQLASHVDHVLPRAHGGGDDVDNLRAACAPHNLARGAGRTPARRPIPTSGWSW